jgi:hypothetical protein
MVEFINLTAHEIVIYDEEGKNIILRIPPSGKIARVATDSRIVGKVDNIPIRKTVYGEIIDLPDPKPGVVYLVSTVLLMALKEKGMNWPDVLSPDTTPDSAIRDEQGRIIGVKYLQTL